MMNRESVSRYIQPLEPIATTLVQNGRITDRIACVLFDIYGTLFISSSGDMGHLMDTPIQMQRLETLLETYHVQLDAQTLMERLTHGIRQAHRLAISQGVDHPEVEIDAIWQTVIGPWERGRIRQFALEFEWIVNPVYPMPYLGDLLKHCREGGLKMGIVSNAQFMAPLLFSWFLDADLTELGFDPALTVFSYQHGIAKPSTRLFAIAADTLERIGIQPQTVLYLGNDMLNDILPAKQTGFQAALFAGDARSLRLRKDDPACRGITPDIVITDLRQLIRLLQV
ncbi:HAD family hydrolase [bacterium]|nr:HAD family hydrolase [bacterium]